MTFIDQDPVKAHELARLIEPSAIASWPSREAVSLDDWLLRFTNGFTHRGNSVATLHFRGGDTGGAIARVEREYRSRGLPPMFQIASAAEPEDLAGRLRDRGYEIVSPTSVQVAEIAVLRTRLPEPAEVTLAPAPTNAFVALVKEGSRSEQDGEERIEIFGRIAHDLICVTANADGRAVACGTGTLVNGHVGINMMRTTPAYRRLGHAQRVLAAIAQWADEKGAELVYLGVEMANAPAIALYARAGFVPAYSYRYYRKSA